MIVKKTRIAALLGLLALATTSYGARLEVFIDLNLPQVEIVIKELQTALHEEVQVTAFRQLDEQAGPVGLVLLLADNTDVLEAEAIQLPNELQAEGFSIRKTTRQGNTLWWLVGADSSGLLYGGYELAEQIRCYGLHGMRETDQSPYMAMRGTKFNLPLDVRTPSYSDASDAAQQNMAEIWSFDFWKAYIQSLARHRYNYISCWNLHPFPSLVRVPGYEAIALDDVQRSTKRWNENYHFEANDLATPEILENPETLLYLTIDEKIAFWRRVMAYAKRYNIDFYFVTWNIHTNGTQGKYGITEAADNPVTRDYFRKSVRQMFLTYPDLKGIGLTTGENMFGNSFEEKEDWAFETYAQGVLDVAKAQPGRKITLIHRQHFADALEIAEKFKPVIEHPDIEFLFSFKYAQAHVYSSTRQNFHEQFIDTIKDRKELKTIWTLRNDDVYHFRWGAPDFVREFIQNIPYGVSRGYYFGSDQYIWGREFLSLEPEFPRQIEIDKHWYQWMLWGRLGYDPSLGNERITSLLQARFQETNAPRLFTAWQEASMIYPVTTGFHWGAIDLAWYIEGCQSSPHVAHTPTGFHDVNRFITLGAHPATDNIRIPRFVRAQHEGKALEGTTPPEVVANLHAHADKALALIKGIPLTGNKELRQTLDDIRTMGFLGKYYAHKIEAATELERFRLHLDPSMLERCVDQLNQAATCWRTYASLALANYRNPLWTNRVGHVDWQKTFQGALYDIRSVGGSVELPNMEPSSGGTLLEAEDAPGDPRETLTEVPGYTGRGYVELSRDDRVPNLEWTYTARVPGRHVLELRYCNRWDRVFESTVSINGFPVRNLNLWRAGNRNQWVWDRLVVDLKQGANTITLHGGGRYLVDHLNVIALLESSDAGPSIVSSQTRTITP